MPTYVVKHFKIRNTDDLEKFSTDLKPAMRATAKELKASIKKIKVTDDSIQFNVEPTAVADKVVEAIKSGLRAMVSPAAAPLSALAEKYGFTVDK